MSFFAGIFSLSRDRPASYFAELAAAAALPDDFEVSRYEDTDLVILHGDLGALTEPGFHKSDSAITAVAGALLLTAPSGAHGRSELASITSSVIQGRLEDLRTANGTFALCCYDLRSGRLTLASDCIGGRPLYYAIAEGLLFFSTSLAALKRMERIPRTVVVGSYIEQEALCYPLGARTVYREINVLLANECLIASRGTIASRTYFDWASVPAAAESPHELAVQCHRALRDAVACRARPGARQTSLLSGGLDSRVLVAQLLDLGYEVEVRNVAREGFQDQVYAHRFAKAAGVSLSTVAWSEDLIGLSAGDNTARLLGAAVAGLSPGPVFSGDGGGETFGFLLMNLPAARLLNEGRVRGGVNEYLKKSHLSEYLFTSEVHQQLRNVVNERMEQELRKIGSPSLEKALHILVLTNDLRRHLHDYFDQITESRVELLLPYYDRRVIESVLRIPPPLEPFMKHHFYHRMIGLMTPIISSVPWQTYPGHAECPVEDPSPPRRQWSQPTGARDGKLAARGFRLALSRDFVPFLRRSVVLAAAALHWARVGNYDYLFRTCINLHELCGRNGSYVIRDSGIPSAMKAHIQERNGESAVLSSTRAGLP